jgi:VIT1/CCC1 family predicted Fe2+/Mn2+ transporter
MPDVDATDVPEAVHPGDHPEQDFLREVIQPGLAGLMDGSVSTLAPIFAAAFATQDSWKAFLIGLAAAVGAGISMAFAEGLSDDGKLTGRGRPVVRGLVCGGMTFLGGIGHTLPFLIEDFRAALILATLVVIVELVLIAWIRKRYMQTPFMKACVQVIIGGGIVFAAGVLIGIS